MSAHRSSLPRQGAARRRRGRHRAKSKLTGQPYKWLGTGALTVGFGVALVGGASVAHADTTSSGDSSSASSDSSSRPNESPAGDSSGESSTGGIRDAQDAEAASESTSGTRTSQPRPRHHGPATSISASGGNVKTEISSTSTESGSITRRNAADHDETATADERSGRRQGSDSRDDTPGTEDDSSGTRRPTESRDTATDADDSSERRQRAGVEVHDGSQTPHPKPAENEAANQPAEPSADANAPVTPSIAAMTALAAEATPTADNGPSSGPAMAMAMSFAPAPPAAVTAYIQQFRDADPTDQFQTPASRDWGGNTDPPPASPVPFSPNDPRLAQVVAAVGMAGFSRDPLGNLTYTNQHNFKVALLYATDPNFNPEGIRVANLGATVTIPGGASKFAIALGPKTYTPAGQLGSDMVVAFAGPGYPPAGVVNLPPMAPPATTVSRPTPRATRSGGTVVAASYSAPKLPTLKLSKPPVAQT